MIVRHCERFACVMECDLMGTGFDASDKAAQRSVINPLFFLKSLID